VKIAQCVENFVVRKRVCGYEYDSSARILRRFAAFVGKIDIALVSEEHINLFLTRGHLAHHIWRSYRSLIRRFLAYWFARRQISRIPEPEQKPNIGTRFFPYIYSKAEIARLLAAAPICQERRRCTISSSTLSTILLFIYGTAQEKQIVVRQIPVVAKISRMFAAKSRIVVIPSQEFVLRRQFWEMDARMRSAKSISVRFNAMTSPARRP
jgi:hypothetical protein